MHEYAFDVDEGDDLGVLVYINLRLSNFYLEVA